jgi:serine phosphatase RsbU (regulator of sigma subunit)
MSSLLAKLGFGAAETGQTSEVLLADTPALDGAELAIAYFSSRLGGDLHDFVRVSPTRFLFGMLDVAGKRQANASVLDAVQASFRSSAEELFSAPELNELDAIIELSRRLNLEIMRSAGGVRSCPAFAGCYNEELGTVCYVNAGHTPALVRDGNGIVELPATGLPLGLFSLAPTDACIVGLEPNASLVVISRGVVEAELKGRELGLEGVKATTQGTPATASAEEISRRILKQVQEFMHTVPKHNDVTALTLTRKGPGAIGPYVVPSVK